MNGLGYSCDGRTYASDITRSWRRLLTLNVNTILLSNQERQCSAPLRIYQVEFLSSRIPYATSDHPQGNRVKLP